MMDDDPPPVTYQPLLVEDGSIGAEEGRPARLLEDKESIVISSTCPDPSVELCKCDKPAKKKDGSRNLVDEEHLY